MEIVKLKEANNVLTARIDQQHKDQNLKSEQILNVLDKMAANVTKTIDIVSIADAASPSRSAAVTPTTKKRKIMHSPEVSIVPKVSDPPVPPPAVNAVHRMMQSGGTTAIFENIAGLSVAEMIKTWHEKKLHIHANWHQTNKDVRKHCTNVYRFAKEHAAPVDFAVMELDQPNSMSNHFQQWLVKRKESSLKIQQAVIDELKNFEDEFKKNIPPAPAGAKKIHEREKKPFVSGIAKRIEIYTKYSQ